MQIYKGWNCAELVSSNLSCLITLDVGPRIISLSISDSPNIFYTVPEDEARINDAEYRHYGGHRLWTTPESQSYTYHPENTPPSLCEHWFTSAPDKQGLQKGLKVSAVPQGFLVEHRLTNVGSEAVVESSPWGITMLRGGGYAIFPNEPAAAHGSSSFLPVRSLSLWAYTRMNDPRLVFGEQVTTVKHMKNQGIFKIGAYVSEGWGAYVLDSIVFHKTFSGAPDVYPDRGANFEIFTNDELLETETTGTVRKLCPGESVCCKEVWQGFVAETEDIVDECRRRALAVKELVN